MLIEKTEIPPRGWNSFDCYMGGITEEQALANLEIFLKKLKPHGYEYFCLDAGWYADGDQKLHEQRIAARQFRTLNLDEFGRYIPSPVNFPHGLRTLADRCHENGIKFGLHMMRGLPLGAVERNTPVKDTPYHARDIYDPDGACSWCQYWVAAKADHPGTLAFYKSEVEYLTEELEVDFIKLDDVVEHPDHVTLFGEAVASVPRPVLLSLSPGGECCRENWETLEKYGNMVRITSDAWDHDETNLQKLQRWYEFQDLSSDSLRADLDMLPLGALQVTTDFRQSRLTPRGKRVMMTIMALSGSPLIFGGDLPRTPQEDFDFATHPAVLECNAWCIPGRRVSFQHHIDIRKSPDRRDSSHGWIGVFSTSELPRHIVLSPHHLGFSELPPLRELWSDYEVAPTADGNAEFYLPPYDAAFLKY